MFRRPLLVRLIFNRGSPSSSFLRYNNSIYSPSTKAGFIFCEQEEDLIQRVNDIKTQYHPVEPDESQHFNPKIPIDGPLPLSPFLKSLLTGTFTPSSTTSATKCKQAWNLLKIQNKSDFNTADIFSQKNRLLLLPNQQIISPAVILNRLALISEESISNNSSGEGVVDLLENSNDEFSSLEEFFRSYLNIASDLSMPPPPHGRETRQCGSVIKKRRLKMKKHKLKKRRKANRKKLEKNKN